VSCEVGLDWTVYSVLACLVGPTEVGYLARRRKPKPPQHRPLSSTIHNTSPLSFHPHDKRDCPSLRLATVRRISSLLPLLVGLPGATEEYTLSGGGSSASSVSQAPRFTPTLQHNRIHSNHPTQNFQILTLATVKFLLHAAAALSSPLSSSTIRSSHQDIHTLDARYLLLLNHATPDALSLPYTCDKASHSLGRTGRSVRRAYPGPSPELKITLLSQSTPSNAS